MESLAKQALLSTPLFPFIQEIFYNSENDTGWLSSSFPYFLEQAWRRQRLAIYFLSSYHSLAKRSLLRAPHFSLTVVRNRS